MTPEEQWLQQKERLLAWLRMGFSLAAIVVIHLNPERVARFPTLSYASLYFFSLYSLLALYFATREKPDFRKIGIWTTCLDLLWVSVIVASTGGSRTPFFVYYLFPVITASSRYGINGSLVVASVGVTLYGFIRFSPLSERPIGIDTYIIRMIYLLVLAYIFGYISEFEKKQNQKLMALYKTASEVATQEERKRIARELHDRLLQVLGSLTLRLEACRRHLLGSTKELEAELALMEESTRSSIQEIRTFLSGKVIEPFTPGTLVERVREEMRFLRDGLGLRVILDVEPEDLALAPQVECELYYVLREGLMNIARHAQASKVQIHLRQVGSEIQGSLEDDGIGFDVAKLTDSGYGLSSMRERIQRAGGRFSVESSPGNGTTIAFRVPTLVSGEEWKEIGGGHGEERRNRD